MPLKKPSVLFSFYSKCHTLSSPPHHSVSSSNLHQTEITPIRRRSSKSGKPPVSRNFATMRDEQCTVEDIQWPKTSGDKLPTPYQIFQQRRSDPYSKRRFYELVMIYHPDRHPHSRSGPNGGPLAHTVMVERYRLVVAANDILSHPDRRKAYDDSGAGWDGRPERRSRRYQWSYNSDGHWSGFEDNNSSPFRNATWEDWEDWYRRNERGEREPQRPVYFSNGGFLSLVAIVACLGGIGQSTRIGDQNISYLKKVESVNAECTGNVQRRMEKAQGYDNRDTRVSSFIKAREESVGHTAATNDDTKWRLLPPPNIR